MISRQPEVKSSFAFVLIAVTFSGCTQSYPGIDSIVEEDLIRDVTELAHDDFRGRGAGTVDELRAAAWLAERACEVGLQPGGEDDSYWQFYDMRTVRLSPTSEVVIGGRPFAIGTDVLMNSAVETASSGTLVWVGDTPSDRVAASRIRGRPVAAMMEPPATPPTPGMSLSEYRYARSAIRERSRALLDKGATAVVLVSDSIADIAFTMNAAGPQKGRTRFDTESMRVRPVDQPPVLWLPAASRRHVSQGQFLRVDLRVESFVYPSASIVAVVPGTDRSLADEYMLFSALLGTVSPHKNSTDLVEIALAANSAVAGFTIDNSWDDHDHPENFFSEVITGLCGDRDPRAVLHEYAPSNLSHSGRRDRIARFR